MSDANSLRPELADYRGRSQQTVDDLGPAQLRRIAATLSEDAPGPGTALPPLWHWAFFDEPVPEAELGPDGHPRRGSFLPPVADRNRMWAGSRVEFHAPLIAAIEASRVSTITHLEEKHGRTGALLFVTVLHEIRQRDRLAIREHQDIVYREPSPPKRGGAAPLPEGDWRETVVPSETLLFRFSAVTFNSHRIHYDWPYVTAAEGYPGLVVHGPLLAILSLGAFRRAHPDAQPRRFVCRGVRPLLAPEPFEVGGRRVGPGHAELWAGTSAGAAQTSEVTYD